jgi:tripartite-type tricarboxylate transporter receptor subunit TctC
MPTALPQVKAGKLRALAVTTSTRSSQLPELSTVAEAGVPGFDAVGWTLFLAPAGTPKPIIDRLSTELSAIAQTPDIQALIVRLGTIPVKSPTPPELETFLATEIERWGKLIERAGMANTL